jgi:4-hydroxyphenylpyruvate dioxygenase
MKQNSLRSIDHVELYVFNAFQAANFYRAAFGFDIIAYAGPEIGRKDQVSYLLLQWPICLVISFAITRDSPLLKHVINYDESVKDIAFMTNNVPKLYEAVKRSGTISILEPTKLMTAKLK